MVLPLIDNWPLTFETLPQFDLTTMLNHKMIDNIGKYFLKIEVRIEILNWWRQYSIMR